MWFPGLIRPEKTSLMPASIRGIQDRSSVSRFTKTALSLSTPVRIDGRRVAVRGLSCDDVILFGSEVSPNQMTVRATVSENLSVPQWLPVGMVIASYALLATAFTGSRRGTELP